MKASKAWWAVLALALNTAWAENDSSGHADLEHAAVRATVVIPPETIQNIGVRTEDAALAGFGIHIRSYGLVTENVRNAYAISSRVAGWIEDLKITAVGDEVRKGKPALHPVQSRSDFRSTGLCRGPRRRQ